MPFIANRPRCRSDQSPSEHLLSVSGSAGFQMRAERVRGVVGLDAILVAERGGGFERATPTRALCSFF